MLNKLPHSSLASPPEVETLGEQCPSTPFSWRDHLPVHPLADAYPKVPHERLVEIGKSIRQHGLDFPIFIHAKGDPANPEVFELIDGVTRLDSLTAVGIKFEFERFRFRCGDRSLRLVIHDIENDPTNPTTKIFNNLEDAEIAAKIDNANLHRRHLEPEQFRARIKAALEREPLKSDRAHAEELGVDHKTVGKVRRSTGEASPVDGKRVGKDGRARKQPAKKPRSATKKTAPSPATDSSPTPAPSADDLAVQRKADNAARFDRGTSAAIAADVNPDDQLIRAGEAAAAEYTRSVEASAISREQILAEFFAEANVADILARLPEAKRDQLREQAVDSWFGDLDLDSVLDRIPNARWSELTDLCISACTKVETLVVPVKTPRKLLGHLNGTLRWTLGRQDVGEAGKGVKYLQAKLTVNKRSANELRLVFVKGK